eukprot:scaffold214787_cov18-Prasinocladus_malaysianus.AAC.1
MCSRRGSTGGATICVRACLMVDERRGGALTGARGSGSDGTAKGKCGATSLRSASCRETCGMEREGQTQICHEWPDSPNPAIA